MRSVMFRKPVKFSEKTLVFVVHMEKIPTNISERSRNVRCLPFDRTKESFYFRFTNAVFNKQINIGFDFVNRAVALFLPH